MELLPDAHSSKMFREAPEDVLDLLENENVTVNAHQFCIVDEVCYVRFVMDGSLLGSGYAAPTLTILRQRDTVTNEHNTSK